MHQYIDRLIQHTSSKAPEFRKVLEQILSNKFFVNYPLSLIQQKQKCIFPNSSLFLKTESLIRPKNHVFYIESNEFFSSSNFAGATSTEEQRLENKMQDLKEKYELFDQDMVSRIRLTLCVQANVLDKDMHLNTYANFILKNRKNPAIENYIKTHANSGFLKSVLNSNKLAVQTAFEFLNKSFMQSIKLQDFSSAYETVRFYSKQANKLRVIFPFCNNLKHSFEPNCELNAMFQMHRRQTFLTLSSIKEIQPGECLTINYGNQNNYEFFVRYGFTIENNPYSEFYLPIDYSDIDDIFNTNMDWKMDMLRKNKRFKIKNFIRIDRDGNIHPDDFNMLKIIFATTPLKKEEFQEDNYISKTITKQINEFVKMTANRFIWTMDKIIQKKKELNKNQTPKVSQNQLEQALLHHVTVIQTEERKILKFLVNKK